MATRIKTIKGWVNNSTFLFSENSTASIFQGNLKAFVHSELKGYTKLPFNKTLRGIKHTHKVIIKGWYWRGSWSDPTKQTYGVYYK